MQKRLIFDLGMHKGEDSEFYLKKGFSVVAVEANPVLVASTSQRLQKYVKSGQLKIINKAISREAGPVTFYSCETASIWGTTDRNWADRNRRLGARIQEMVVDGIAFSSLLQEFDAPYYLKIDIEGTDILCLESLLKQSDRPKFISLESSKDRLDEVDGELSLFEQLGYNKFKIIPQHRINEQTLPYPSREGVYVEHQFELGCSGAFGLELPGEWLSRDHTIKQYRKIHRLYRLTGESGVFTSARFVRSALNKSRTHPDTLTGMFVRKIVKPAFRRLGLVTGWYDTHAMFSG